MSCVLSRLIQQPLLISDLHLLLHGRLHHLNFHVLQELHHVYSLGRSIINLWAGGIALWKRADTYDTLEATSDGRGVVGVALEALVPSVQRCALDPSIYPGAAEKGHKMMDAQKQTTGQTLHRKRLMYNFYHIF